MNPPTLLTLVTLLMAMTSTCRSHSIGIIDLTHKMDENSMTWPTNPRFNFSILFRGHMELLDSWVENNQINLAEHTGTHFDSPAHFIKGGWRVHQVPPERLVGEGVMVDIRDKVKTNDIYTLTVNDLETWESQHGQIPDTAIVMVNSGWASRYPDWNRVYNTNDFANITSFRFPGVTLEAATWLVEKRNIVALGMDTPSPETLLNLRAPVHEYLLGRSVLIIESVANLNSLPPKGTTIILGALNLYEGSGAPMRILALKGRFETNTNTNTNSQSFRSQISTLGLAGALTVGLGMIRLLGR